MQRTAQCACDKRITDLDLLVRGRESGDDLVVDLFVKDLATKKAMHKSERRRRKQSGKKGKSVEDD